MRQGLGFIWAGVLVLIGLAIGVGAYQAGWAAGVAAKLPADALAAHPYFYGPHFFLFGFLPFFLFFLLLLFAFRGGWRHRGYGRWHMHEHLQEWHRQAHGEQTPPNDQPK